MGRRQTSSQQWGLGIEHEMLFGKGRPTDAVTRIVDTFEIVSRHNDARIEALYAKYGAKKRSRTREALPTRARDAALVLDEEYLRTLRRERPFAAFPFEAQSAVDPKDAEVIMKTELPLLSSGFNPYFVWLFVNVFRTQPQVRISYVEYDLIVDEFLTAIDEFRRGGGHGRKLLSNAVCADYKVLERAMSESLSKFMESNLLSFHVGDRIVVDDHVLPMATLIKCSDRAKKRRALSSIEALGVFLEVVHGAVSYSADESIEQDGQFVEVKTLKFKNASVDRVARELFEVEARATAIAKAVDEDARPLLHSGEVVLFDDGQDARVSYTGSFHVWITLPHRKDVLSQTGFLMDHALLAANMQWLEPLLLSLTSCDPRSIGAGGAYPRANMRGQTDQNMYSGIATTRSCVDLVPQTKVRFPFYYFTGASFETWRIHDGAKQPVEIWISYDGERFEKYAWSKDVGRLPPQERDGDDMYDDAPMVAKYHKKDEEEFVSLASELPHDAKYSMSQGNNVRSPLKPGPELRPGIEAFVVRNSAAKRFEFRFRDGRGVVSAKAQLVADKRMAQGIEFRVMDNMPTQNIVELVRLVTLVAAVPLVPCVAPSSKPYFFEFVADVLLRGRYARVPDEYSRAICKRFGLEPIPTVRPREYAFEFLGSLAARLFEAYSKSDVPKLMNRTFIKPPTFIDSNSMAFDYLLAKMEAHSHKLKESIRTFTDEDQFMTKMGEEWRYDVAFVSAFVERRTKSLQQSEL